MEEKSTKDTRKLAQERRQHIFEDIESSGIASVRDLAQRFEVSTITIMRDLQELEQEGLIRRVHGGAISVRGASYEPPFLARESQLSPEKRRIAAQAVAMISDGQRRTRENAKKDQLRLVAKEVCDIFGKLPAKLLRSRTDHRRTKLG